MTPMKSRSEPQGGQAGESLGCLESVLLKCRCIAISGRRGTPLGGRASRSSVCLRKQFYFCFSG